MQADIKPVGWVKPRGTIVALTSGIAFGAAHPASRLALDADIGVLTLAFTRFAVLALLLMAWLWFRGGVGRYRPGLLAKMMGTGLVTSVITCANLLAIGHIPVSTATLVFYTYPLMTVALSAAVFSERVSPVIIGCMILALTGLTLALQVSFETLSLLGVAYSLTAAGASAVLFIWSRVLMRDVPSMALTMVSAGGGALAMGVILLVTGTWQLPLTPTALGYTAALSGMFVVAYITMFVAVRTAGPVHTSMLMNIEPVVAIGGAVVLLNEVLTVPQVVGVSIVVIAITVMQASAARPVPSARNP